MCVCEFGKLALMAKVFTSAEDIKALTGFTRSCGYHIHCLRGRMDSDAGFETTDYYHNFIQFRSHHSDLFPLDKSTELAFFNFPFLVGIELLRLAICSSC